MQERDKKFLARLANRPELRLAVVFGSCTRGAQRFESDLDVGVAGPRPLTIDERGRLTEELAEATERPVDILDLQTAGIPVLTQVLTTGRIIFCDDEVLYVTLLKRMVFEQADFMPLRARLLRERRQAWIGP